MIATKQRALLMRILLEKQRRRRLVWGSVICVVRKYWQIKLQILIILLNFLLSKRKRQCSQVRSCRRLRRNAGWFICVFNVYSDKRFKDTFRLSRNTFDYILCRIQNELSRVELCEIPISPRERLAIGLYRLARGDYYYTLSQMTGLGVATVCNISREVSQIIVETFWEEAVASLYPTSTAEFKSKILDMEEFWQFPLAYAAIDGCHIPIKCPAGGGESKKEYHNFKNFYSIILMALVDAKYRFIWAACGFPGNSHDAIVFQSTEMYKHMAENDILPSLSSDVNGIKVPPLILGDSAFPFRTWLMKPFTNAVLNDQQRNFNYRLSRARMVTEGAYGQLKGRWRVLHRKCDSKPLQVKSATLACIVLHNLCISLGDTVSKKFDLTHDTDTNERRSRDEIEKLLLMIDNHRVPDTSRNAIKVRQALVQKLWEEHENA